MTAADIEDLRHALRALAGEIAGMPPVRPGRVELPAGDFADAYRRHRDELLLGAALLTGRGDEAQDTLHVAASRVILADPQPPAALAELCRAIVRQARHRPAGHTER